MNLKKLFLIFNNHSIKISYIFLLIVVAIALLASKELPFGDSFWKNLLCVGGVILGARLLFGGWTSYSFKGMTWSTIMATAGSLIFMIYGMRSGTSHSVHVWPILITIGVALAIGVMVYKFTENLIDDSTEYSLDEDALIDSINSFGIKNTVSGIFNEFVDDSMGQMYYSASRGVAAYSNTVFFMGLIVCMYYMG